MPRRHVIKKYRKNCYYHVYCRGNNREKIYFDEQDYFVFRIFFQRKIRELNLNIALDCYALMPNHYHFLLYQFFDPRAIERLMRSCLTQYSLYINKKYKRVGRLFQSPYHARIVSLREIEKMRIYVLNNPIEAGLEKWKHCGNKL